jgi:hypothetical protein
MCFERRLSDIGVFISKIYTSLGRVAHFPPKLSEKPAWKPFRSVRVEKEDMVVGFWGTMVRSTYGS